MDLRMFKSFLIKLHDKLFPQPHGLAALKWLICIAAASMAIYQMSLLYGEFQSGITTMVEIGFPAAHQLPALTVCIPWTLVLSLQTGQGQGGGRGHGVSTLIKTTDAGQTAAECEPFRGSDMKDVLAATDLNMTSLNGCVMRILRHGNWTPEMLRAASMRPADLVRVTVKRRSGKVALRGQKQIEDRELEPSVTTYDLRGKCFSFFNRNSLTGFKDGDEVNYPYRTQYLTSVELVIDLRQIGRLLAALQDPQTGKYHKGGIEPPFVEINSPFKLPGSDAARLRWSAELKTGGRKAVWFYYTAIHMIGAQAECSDYVGEVVVKKLSTKRTSEVNSHDHCISEGLLNFFRDQPEDLFEERNMTRGLFRHDDEIEAMDGAEDEGDQRTCISLVNRIPFILADLEDSWTKLVNCPWAAAAAASGPRGPVHANLDDQEETCFQDCTKYIYEVREMPYEADQSLPVLDHGLAPEEAEREAKNMRILLRPSMVSPSTVIRHMYRLTPVEFLTSLMALAGMWVGIPLFSICSSLAAAVYRLAQRCNPMTARALQNRKPKPSPAKPRPMTTNKIKVLVPKGILVNNVLNQALALKAQVRQNQMTIPVYIKH